MTQQYSYQCDKCGEPFEFKAWYDRHLKKKKDCSGLSKTHNCDKCGGRFPTASFLRKHAVNCTEKKTSASGEAKFSIGDEKSDRGDSKSFVRGDSKSLKYNTEVAAGTLGQMVFADKSIVNTMIDQRIIHVNVFGQEFYNHISRENILELLNKEGKTTGSEREIVRATIVEVARMLYNDEKYIENVTCYMANKKKNLAMIHEKDGWVSKSCGPVMEHMTAKTIRTLFEQQPLPGCHGMDDGESLEFCTPMLASVRDKEEEMKKDPPAEFRDILSRNKEILQRKLGRLPVENEKFPPPDPAKRSIPRLLGDLFIFGIGKAIIKHPIPDIVNEEYSKMLLLYCAKLIGGCKTHLHRRALARVVQKVGEASTERGFLNERTQRKLKQVHEHQLKMMYELSESDENTLRRFYKICDHTDPLCRCDWWADDFMEPENDDDDTEFDINDLY